MKFLIIGGDAAGMSAASKAKRYLPDIDVTVLEQSLDVSYSACGMPYNIADPDRDIEDLVVRSADTFINKNRIRLLTGLRAQSIDRQNRQVKGRSLDGQKFEESYDKLLIATGASPEIPDVPGADLDGILPLKSLDHGRRIKEWIARKGVRHSVIVGMGYIGLEMAEALRERDIQVEMIKPGPVFLPWMTRELADAVLMELETNGVTLHTGSAITGFEPDDGRITVKTGGSDLTTDMVVVGAGVKPNSLIAEQAGLDTSVAGAISVDASLRTSDPSIFAAGDCADAVHVVTGKKCWIPLALRANRAGWAVADILAGQDVTLQGVVGTAVFKLFDLQVARTGLSLKEAEEAGFDPVETVIRTRSRAHAHKGNTAIHVSMTGDRKSGRLLGVQMVGSEGVAHRINAPAVALHCAMTVEDFFQTDLAYAPPFGPVWDPLLTAANQLLKKL